MLMDEERAHVEEADCFDCSHFSLDSVSQMDTSVWGQQGTLCPSDQVTHGDGDDGGCRSLPL